MPDTAFQANAQRLLKCATESLFGEFAGLCDGMLVVDQSARIVWMSDSYPKWLGIANTTEAIGRPVEEIIPHSLMREVVTGGRPIMLDMMEVGNESMVVTRLPLHETDGTVIGAVGFVLYGNARHLAPIVSRYQRLRADLADAQRKLAEARRTTKYSFNNFVGSAPACALLKHEARRAARTCSPVLLLGETGTGKELLAQAIHAAGPRAHAPFVAVNIAAIPETLLEAEFFGVAPGAYTGAERGREGKFKIADGGTLFLDEIGDMSPALQAKLLRALQEREIEPVGSNRLTPVDVRIISATSRDLAQEIAAGRFRTDLYYRLNVVSLHIPPLRERLSDLPQLCEFLSDDICRRLSLPPRDVPATVVARLGKHDWPGNVRELANTLERALLMADGDALTEADVERVLPRHPVSELTTPPSPATRTLADALATAERESIRLALNNSRGNKAQAARQLGISRATLYEKLSGLGITD